MRQKALEKRLKGDKCAQGKVAKLGNGQYVQLEREGTDRIFALIVEFGDKRYTGVPGASALTPGHGAAGRQHYGRHRAAAQPDPRAGPHRRQLDAVAGRLQPGALRGHVLQPHGEVLRAQSSGRYSVDGDVTEWVKVPFNEALYGRNYCGKHRLRHEQGTRPRRPGRLGGEPARRRQDDDRRSTEYLKTFDVRDRYDIDGDGNFQEPDGVIDHFQIVHAGGDEAAGDPTRAPTRSGATAGGPTSGAVARTGPGGVNVGVQRRLVSSTDVPNNPTGVWVCDYTIQPENGGLGVFAHEFGHDLGLPDLYDTSGNTGGAENNTAFWSLMTSGANIGDGGPDGIGDAPTDLGAWELFQLGWLEPQGDRARSTTSPGRGAVVAHARLERAGDDNGRRRSSRCCPTRRCPHLGAPFAARRCSGAPRATTSRPR